MAHAVLVEPALELCRDIRGAVIGQQPWPVVDVHGFQTTGLERQLERVADVLSLISGLLPRHGRNPGSCYLR